MEKYHPEIHSRAAEPKPFFDCAEALFGDVIEGVTWWINWTYLYFNQPFTLDQLRCLPVRNVASLCLAVSDKSLFYGP
jgi:hypothetical protein